MNIDLTGRSALVTGASRGIGREIALALAGAGAKVACVATNEALLNELAAQIGPNGLAIKCDVSKAAEIDAAVEKAGAAFGGLDILVNNAASTSRSSIGTATTAFWDRMLAINLRAPFILMREALAVMKARGGGSIINIGSILAYVGEPKLGAYSVSKGALMTLTRNAASLLNRDRIRVNQINVGWTLTEGEKRVKREQEGRGDDWIAQAIATRPFGRMLEPRDIAYAAAYFASDESACVTGSVLDLEQYPPGAMPNS